MALAAPTHVADVTTVAAGPGTLAGVVTGLDALLDAAAGLDLGSVTGQELAEATVALHALTARLDGLDARVVSRFSGSAHWAQDGSRTVRSWLRERTSAGEATIAARASAAAWVDAYPVFAARLAAGLVSVEHLRVLADAHAQHRVISRVLAAAEEVIAEFAVGRPPAELRRFLAELVLRAAPDVVDEAEGQKLKQRARLQVRPLLDGWVHLEGLLPPDLGAKFLACLRAAGLAAPDPAAPGGPAGPAGDASTSGDAGGAGGAGGANASGDAGGAGATGGRDPGLTCDPRPIHQRNLHALARLLDHAETGLGGDRLPSLRGSRPVVTIVVDAATLTAHRGDPDQAPATLGGPATPTSGETARRLACDAALRRLVIDPTSQAIDVGRLTRTIPPALRAAVHWRDQGRCRWPGCRCPIDEIHHIVHWAHGGDTSRTNTLGLCWWHHHLLHDDGWHLTGDAEHTIAFHNPHRPIAPPLTSTPPGRDAGPSPPSRCAGPSVEGAEAVTAEDRAPLF